MKIVFTGGGTGGHFFPIIAVAQEVRTIVVENKLLEPRLYYFGPKPYDQRALFELDIEFRKVTAGKIRNYPSIWNYIDILKTGWGIFSATLKLFLIYPHHVPKD